MPFYFGGTSLLIMVVVVMDFMAQLQAHLMSHQYEGLMKKANLQRLRPQRRAAADSGGFRHESSSLGQEDLQELQDRAPSGVVRRHLLATPRHKQRQG